MTFAEPVGRRRVLVVQNDIGNAHSPTTVIARTSATPRRDYPFLVALGAAELGKPSWVHCETLNTVPCDPIEERRGTLALATMARVDEAFRHSLGLG